jgi:hypothetical protein
MQKLGSMRRSYRILAASCKELLIRQSNSVAVSHPFRKEHGMDGASNDQE